MHHTPRRHRSFRPTVSTLESRHLLSTASLLGGSYGKVDFNAIGGTVDSTSLDGKSAVLTTSVGSMFQINVETRAHPVSWDPQGSVGYHIVEVDYSLPNTLDGNYTSVHNLVQNTDERSSGSIHTYDDSDVPVTMPFRWQDSEQGYIDEKVGQDNLSVTVKYRGQNGAPDPSDETFNITLNAVKPTGSIALMQSPTSGTSGAWGWGAFNVGGSPKKFTPTGFGIQPSGTNYQVGFAGPKAMTYSIRGNNFTPNTGTFSVMQFVKGVMRTDAVEQNPTGNLIFSNPYSLQPVSKVYDTNGQWQVDVTQNGSIGKFKKVLGPKEFFGTKYADQSSGSLFGDNPAWTISASRSTNRFAYSMSVALEYQTDLIWTPNGGVPIVVSTLPWQIKGFRDNNPVLAEGLGETTPLWDTAYGFSGNWQEKVGDGMTFGPVKNETSLLPQTEKNTPQGLIDLGNSANQGYMPSYYTISNNWTAPKILTAQNTPDWVPPLTDKSFWGDWWANGQDLTRVFASNNPTDVTQQDLAYVADSGDYAYDSDIIV